MIGCQKLAAIEKQAFPLTMMLNCRAMERYIFVSVLGPVLSHIFLGRNSSGKLHIFAYENGSGQLVRTSLI